MTDWKARAEKAEAALAELMVERNQLWNASRTWADRADDLRARLAAAEKHIDQWKANWLVTDRIKAERDALRAKLAAAETRFNLDCPTPDGCIGKQKAEAELDDLRAKAGHMEELYTQACESRDDLRALLDAERKTVGDVIRQANELEAKMAAAEAGRPDWQASWQRMETERDAALAKVRELEGIEGEVAKVEHNGVWARIATDRLHQIDEAMARVKELEGALRGVLMGIATDRNDKLCISQDARAAVAHARQVLEGSEKKP